MEPCRSHMIYGLTSQHASKVSCSQPDVSKALAGATEGNTHRDIAALQREQLLEHAREVFADLARANGDGLNLFAGVFVGYAAHRRQSSSRAYRFGHSALSASKTQRA